MKDSPLQLALREVQRMFAKPTTWLVLLGIGLVVSISGAFGTDSAMRPVPRALYWMTMVPLTFGLGSVISGVTRRSLSARGKGVVTAATGLATGVAITALVTLVNTALFGWFWTSWQSIGVFALSTTAVAGIIAVTLDLAMGAPGAKDGAGNTAPILERLPLSKRGALISISAVDHYVDVVTDKGNELILMRLSDAIMLTAPVAGLQIHRSHWVALAQIGDVAPGAGKATLTTSDGRTLPVSRTNLAKLREAGLLPA